MTGRRCLVIGGGDVAERKVEGLLEAKANVTVISPDISEKIARWSEQHVIVVAVRRYRAGDLAGYQMAFVATDDSGVNRMVYDEGKKLGVWVNAADDPAHCDFILPSVLRRGEVMIAVSTGGKSPALSRAIREELEIHFPQEYESLVEVAAEVRNNLRRQSITPSYEVWRKALNGDVRRHIQRGDLAQAKRFLLKELGAAECE
jgi:siroheme synthase-like protein